jgi:S1-C subfamily serine protease
MLSSEKGDGVTNSLINPPTQQLPAALFEENRRQRRRATFAITVIAAILGTLLIAGALLWTNFGDRSDTISSTASTPVIGESNTTAETVSGATGATDVSGISAEAVDSIVVVEVTIDARGPFDASSSGSGSGVIISEDGTIVTNAHVVDDATSITVELTNGTTYTATVLAEDTSEDIAILVIDASGLTAIELGSTTALAVGDPVIAIGNPLALEGGPSVSTGIVSALDRTIEDSDTTLTGIIQTDAAITEGSSGGALLDADGRLVGITTAVGVSSVGVEGIAFAVPVETVSEILATLIGV